MAILNIILGVFNSYQKRLNRCHIHKRLNELTHIHDIYQRLDESLLQMSRALKEKLRVLNHRLDRSDGLLKALNPQNVLERGYGYVETSEGLLVSSAIELDGLVSGAQLNLHFHDGKRKVQKL